MFQSPFRRKYKELIEILFLFGLVTFPFVNVRPLLGLSISDLCFLLSFLLLIFNSDISLKSHNKKIFLHPFLFPCLLIILGGVISSLNSFYPADSLKVLLKIFYVFSLLPILVMKIIDDNKVKKVLNAIIIGITFSSCVAIIDSVFGLRIGPSFAINAESTIAYGAAGRYAGVAMHPNIQGNFIAVCLPIIAEFLHSYNKTPKLFLVYLSAFIICSYALILTGSISSLLAAIIGLSIIFVVRQGTSIKRRIIAILGYEIIVGLMLLSVITGFYENIYHEALSLASDNPNISRVMNVTYSSRMDANRYALREIMTHPMIGVGFDNETLDQFAPIGNSGDPSGVHNPIIRSWLAGGLLAFIGYILFYYFTLKTSLTVIIRYLRCSIKPWLLGLSGAAVTFFIFDMAQPSTHMRITWIIFFILYSLLYHQETLSSERSSRFVSQ